MTACQGTVRYKRGCDPGSPRAPEAAASLAGELVAWHRTTRRSLPWRTPFPRDPYGVLVSEIMAQQTQIERVVPFWERFIARFPRLGDLAGATESEVLAAWSGLGYYRRARMLRQAAIAIYEMGDWPRTVADLEKLPGVGPYTAAAVAAFCFAGSEPPVDGNVARVAARVARLSLPLGSRGLLAAGNSLAAVLYQAEPIPEVFEALMELGATLCAPAAPSCHQCPLRSGCHAARHGDPGAHPLPRPQRAVKAQRWVAVWLEQEDGGVLLAQARGPLLDGLWLPPFRVLDPGQDAPALAVELAAQCGLTTALRPAQVVSHAITHRAITIEPFVGCAPARAAELPSDRCWADPHHPNLPTSSLLAKLARVCRQREREV